MSRSSRLIALLAVLACSDDSQSPVNITTTGRIEQEGDFYYYQGTRIELTADADRLIIDARDPNHLAVAELLLAAQGATLSTVRSLDVHGLYRVLRVSAPVNARQAVAVLRADPRIAFVAPIYRTREGGTEVSLVNRIDVQYRAQTAQRQIDSLHQVLGVRVLRAPMPDSGFFAYRLAYPRGVDPLAFSQLLDRHALVEWADPDKIAGRQLFHVPTDPHYSLQFHLKNQTTRNGIRVDINVEPAWDITRGSQSVRVVIIDDGVDIQHGNLGGGFSGDMSSGQWADARGYDTQLATEEENSFQPCCNDTHGTSIAGISWHHKTIHWALPELLRA